MKKLYPAYFKEVTSKISGTRYNTNDQRVVGYCLDRLQEFIDEITVIENSEADNE